MATVAVGVLISAAAAYHFTEPDTTASKYAALARDLSTLAFSGVVLKLLLDRISSRRAEIAERRDKERHFLRRMRAAHVQVAYVREVMIAENSAATYMEQCRGLARAKHDLDEIQTDLMMAPDLFETRNRQDMTDAVGEIVSFIEAILVEYKAASHHLGRVTRRSLLGALERSGEMPETMLFIRGSAGGQDLPWRYNRALERSKGEMREHIYG